MAAIFLKLKRRQSKFYSAQPSWEDHVLWPLIRTVWEPFSRKNSHWWHWKLYQREISHTLIIKGVPHLVSNHENVWKKLFQTNFKWAQCAIFKPKNYSGLYRRGFRAVIGDMNTTSLCEVLLTGPAAGLLGPYDVEFFALSFPDNLPLEIELVEITTKDKLPPEIALT